MLSKRVRSARPRIPVAVAPRVTGESPRIVGSDPSLESCGRVRSCGAPPSKSVPGDRHRRSRRITPGTARSAACGLHLAIRGLLRIVKWQCSNALPVLIVASRVLVRPRLSPGWRSWLQGAQPLAAPVVMAELAKGYRSRPLPRQRRLRQRPMSCSPRRPLIRESQRRPRRTLQPRLLRTRPLRCRPVRSSSMVRVH